MPDYPQDDIERGTVEPEPLRDVFGTLIRKGDLIMYATSAGAGSGRLWVYVIADVTRDGVNLIPYFNGLWHNTGARKLPIHYPERGIVIAPSMLANLISASDCPPEVNPYAVPYLR